MATPHQTVRCFTSTGRPLSRDAVDDIVARHTRNATQACPSLAAEYVTPHVLRHTSAIR